MAKGQKIGSLFYDIDGDNKELMKKIEAAKKEAVSIEKVFSNIKLNFGGKSLTTDVQKAQLSVDKIAVSQNKVAKSAIEVVRAEELAGKAIVDTNNAKKQGLLLDEKRRKEEAQAALAAIRSGEVELNTLIKQEQAKRKALIDEERLTGLRKRNAQIGVQGQRDLAASYGLTNKTMFNQKNLLQQMSSAMGIYFSIYQAGAFVKELATISGEFEKQRVSLAAIIGDAGAANKIFNQIKDLAVISPFNFKELTDYAKQLSAFSIPTNEIFDTTKRLADLSAGLGVDMSRIILAYGQVRSAAVLRGQELRQFTEAGIPLVDELAKKFGELEGRVVSAGEVFDKISNREASFGMVKEIINDLTSEGGKFFEMQELQSATLAGKISNLRDNYDMMLDSLGKANQGLLHGTMDGLVELMDNWERYLAILKSIAVAYGMYKAAIIATTIYQNGLTVAINNSAVAQALFNSVSKANPYALLIAGIAAAISVISSFSSAQQEAREEMYRTIGAINDQADAVNSHIDRLKELTSKAIDDKKAQSERAAIISELSQTEPILASYIQDHSTSLKELIKVQKEYNDLMDARKFGEYLIGEDNGSVFTDGLKDDLEDLAKAQNQLRISVIGLEPVYAKLREEFAKVKQSGLYNGKSIDSNTINQIDGILVNQKNKAEAIREIYNLLGAMPAAKFSYSGLENFTKDIFGGNSQKGIDNYSKAYRDLRMATSEAKEELDEFANSIESYLNNQGQGTESLNSLKQQFEESSGISFKDFIGKDTQEQAKYLTEEVTQLYKKIQSGEQRLHSLVSGISGLTKYGREHILTKWDVSLNGSTDIDNTLSGWRSELQEAFGKSLTIKAESNLNEVLDEAGKKYKEVKESVERNEKILLEFEFNFDTLTFPEEYKSNLLADYTLKAFQADQEQLDNLKKGADLARVSLEDLNKTKTKSAGDKKDALTEKLKTQLDLVKSAKSEYEKLIKVMSSEEALKNIKSISVFNSVDNANLTDSGFLSFISSQIDQLKSKSKLTDKQKEYLISLFSLQNDTVARIAKENVDKIEKELSKYKDQYSLYESLLSSTGNKAFSIKIAFGDIDGQIKSFKDKLKEDLEKTNDPELKKKLTEQLTGLDLSEKVDFAKQMSDLLAKYKTTDQKISSIVREGEKERAKIREQYGDSDYANQLIEASTRKQKEQIDELESETLKLTPLYQRIFGDISSYGSRSLDALITKTSELLDTIKVATKNTDGTYTIDIDGESVEVTEADIARLTKRLWELKKTASGKNPFKLLRDSIKEYNDATNSFDKDKALQNLSKSLADIGTLAQSVGRDLSSMFDALGNNSMKEATDSTMNMLGSMVDIGAGIASGNYLQAAQGVIKGITEIANTHDNELNAAIRISQIELKKVQQAYKNIEYEIENIYGEERFRKSGELVSNLYTQQAHLYSQLQSESDKKKSDDSVIEDYKAQIQDIEKQIKDIFTNIRNEIMGTSESLASNLANSIVNAFLQGEDAAIAWGETVDDIVTNIVKNILTSKYITPEVEKIVKQMMDRLTGSSDADRAAKEKEIESLTAELAGTREFKRRVENANKHAAKVFREEFESKYGTSIENYIKQLEDRKKQADTELGNMHIPNLNKDVLNDGLEALDQLGADFEWMGEFLNQLNLSGTSTSPKDTLSKGIQSVTEDTASLLASYLNAVRADVSAQNQLINNILMLSQTNSSTFANMYAELVRIQINTANTASNTAKLVEISENTNVILKNVTTRGSGTSLNV